MATVLFSFELDVDRQLRQLRKQLQVGNWATPWPTLPVTSSTSRPRSTTGAGSAKPVEAADHSPVGQPPGSGRRDADQECEAEADIEWT